MNDIPPVNSKYLPFWNEKSRAVCIKDNPAMTGFGRPMKIGDEVVVEGVTYDGRYRLAVPAECAFYEMIGYWEAML